MLKTFMDRGIASGEVAPMIVVTPDANFGTRRVSYFNDPDNNFNFEDFFFKEFIPYIEKTYRCRTEGLPCRGRRVHGWWGSLLLCLAPSGNVFRFLSAKCSYPRVREKLPHTTLSGDEGS